MAASSTGAQAWTTARLLLRRPRITDACEVLRLHQDPLAIAYNPSDALKDEPAAQQLVQRWVQHWNDHAIGYAMVSWRDDVTVLGVCGVKMMTLDGRQVLNLLYRLHPVAWGQGLASEAAATMVQQARYHHSGLPVVARVRRGNHASARVALAVGLIRAEHLDTCGEDGPEHLYVSEPICPRHRRTGLRVPQD